MTAVHVVAKYTDGIDGSPFAIVADENGADYVFPGDPVEGLDAARVQEIAGLVETPPQSLWDWLSIAASNMAYVEFGDPVEAPDMDAAKAAAQQALAGDAVTADGSPDDSGTDFTVPQTRAERVAYQRQAMDEWALLYPDAADLEDDEATDPEADLALAQLTTPPVDPTKPHRWLPLALDETECGFCDQPEDAAIHQPGADTITPGSK